MPTDLSLSVRREVLTHLENDATVTALVPAGRIYGIQVPALPDWPFIRYGVPISNGFEATCWNGMTSTITIHAFTETTETLAGEDAAMLVSQAVIESMSSFAPTSVAVIDLQWSNGTILREETEADKFHAVIEFSITAVTRH